MSKSLYNIAAEYQLLAEQCIEDGGELSPELQELLNINKEELETKGQNYGMVVKQCEAEIAIIEAEQSRLDKLVQQRKKFIERLKTNLSGAMQLYGYTEIKTPLLKISFRKSESVEIVNLAQLNEKFKTVKAELVVDKVKIKEAIKAGEEVEGAVIKINQNIQIK